MNLESLMQAICSGILVGGMYGGIAGGVSLIWGIMKVSNFAHGAFIILSVYIIYFLLGAYGIDPIASIIILAPAFFLSGLLLYSGLIKHIQRRAGKWWETASLLALYGLSSCMESLMLFYFTPTPKSINVQYLGKNAIPLFGAIYLPTSQAVGFFLAIFSLLFLALFLKKSRLGKAIRAVSQDKTAALLVGINADKISALACGIGILFAAWSGIIIGINFVFAPGRQVYWCIKSFIVVVLGGIGSVSGVIIGGIILGLCETLFGTLFPFLVKDIFTYLIFILTIVLRTRITFGGRS